MKTIELKAGDFVALAGWQGVYEDGTAQVGTARAYAAKYGEDTEAAHKRALDNGHDTAYAMAGGTCLVADRKLAERMHQERIQQRASAVILKPGQEVIIEGEVFTVRIPHGNMTRPYNSDPIHFVRK